MANSQSSSRTDCYAFTGIQRDVNPFTMKDGDLWTCINWYSHQALAKKVRPGYTQFLNQIDTSPVQNLIYVGPTTPGARPRLFRISNKKLYPYVMGFGQVVWFASIQTFTVDQYTGNTILAGSGGIALHLTNGTDPYMTVSSTNVVTTWANGTANRPHFLTSWRSRVFSDVNNIRFAQSSIGFDITYADPWLQSTLDPASSGTVAVDDAGNGGLIVGLSTTIDRVNIYRQNSVYRYTGQGLVKLAFDDAIIGGSQNIAHWNLGGIDYFLSSKGIYKMDGRSVAPASFGINTIIEDTFNKQGITNPIPFSWGNMTGFYIGNIQIGSEVVPNGCFVHDERYDEWYVWSLGHQMTSFCNYIDPATGVNTLICGDVNGNTYIWGEQYGSDNGTAISFRLRTKYFDFGGPEVSKIPDRIAVSSYKGSEATISVAKNYDDQFSEIDVMNGFIRKVPLPDRIMPNFYALSVEISGSTTSARPEFYGVTIKIKDEGERYNSGSSLKQ